jgi:hypothetical protein
VLAFSPAGFRLLRAAPAPPVRPQERPGARGTPPEPTGSLAPPRPPPGKGCARSLRKRRPQAPLASGRSEAGLGVSAPEACRAIPVPPEACRGLGASGPPGRSRWSRRGSLPAGGRGGRRGHDGDHGGALHLQRGGGQHLAGLSSPP